MGNIEQAEEHVGEGGREGGRVSEWSVLPASPSHPPFLPFVPDVHSYPINAPSYYLSIAFDDLGGASESGKGTGVEKQRLETR